MKRYSCVVWLIGLIPFWVSASNPEKNDKEDPKKDTSKIEYEDVRKSSRIVKALDSAVNAWYVEYNTLDTTMPPSESRKFDPKEIPEYEDSFYKARIQILDETSPINYSYNNWVKPFINLYAFKRRNQVERMLGLAHHYFPRFEAELDRHGLPLRMKYLPVIESALNTHAVSSVGANGLWQFMYTTGKQYGLEITTYVDERRDPQASTEAAIEYMKDMYRIYEDWLMVVAAYNCGPGNVNKAIRRAGYSDNFWDIYPYLPRETRGYVPAFIAAAYIFENHEAHNLYPILHELPTATDTIMIKQKLHFKTIAKGMDIDIKTLRVLNPEYKKDLIPGGEKVRTIQLPLKSSLAFTNRLDTLYALQDSLFSDDDSETVTADSDNDAYTRVYYTVNRGDNLGYIAEWYDCSAADLRRWNRMRSSRIVPGQKLKIFVPTEKADHYEKISELSFSEKQYYERTGRIKTNDNKVEGEDYVYYYVRNGDTLWEIAQKFKGVSINGIKRLNNIRNSRYLKPGQKIKIEKKS